MKANNKLTYADCDQIIRNNKNATKYFNYEMKLDDMWKMLRYRMQFERAETAVIIAALIKAGAKFS